MIYVPHFFVPFHVCLWIKKQRKAGEQLETKQVNPMAAMEQRVKSFSVERWTKAVAAGISASVLQLSESLFRAKKMRMLTSKETTFHIHQPW
jgi:hypothetical protein